MNIEIIQIHEGENHEMSISCLFSHNKENKSEEVFQSFIPEPQYKEGEWYPVNNSLTIKLEETYICFKEITPERGEYGFPCLLLELPTLLLRKGIIDEMLWETFKKQLESTQPIKARLDKTQALKERKD